MQVYTWPPRNHRYKFYGVIALIMVAIAIALIVVLAQNFHKSGSETGNDSNHRATTTTKPTPPKFTEELRIFFGYMINPKDTDSVDLFNLIKISKTIDYLTDCQSWRFNKINVTFVTTFGTLYICNNISDCLDYVEHKLDNDIEAANQISIKTGQNSTYLPLFLQEFRNFFYVNPTQNISMAYLMTDINSGDHECNNWHNNPDLDWILKNENDFKNMFVGQEIYTKFLRIITDVQVTPDCQLIHLTNFSRTDLFQELLIDPVVEAIIEDHGYGEKTRHSLCLELPDHYNKICKQVGKNASTSNAPTSLSHCKTWYTIVAFLLEANATTDEDVKQLQDFITNITAPCNDQIHGQVEFFAPNDEFNKEYCTPCNPNNNGCAQNISHLTKDQMTFVNAEEIKKLGLKIGWALIDNKEAIIAADAVVLYLVGKLSSYDNSTDTMQSLIEAINNYGYAVISYLKEVEIIVRVIVLDVPQGQNIYDIIPSYVFDIADGWDNLITVPHGENLTSTKYVDQLTVCV